MDEEIRLCNVGEEHCPTCLNPLSSNNARKSRLKALDRSIRATNSDVAVSEVILDRLLARVDTIPSLRQDLHKAEGTSAELLRAVAQCEKEVKAANDKSPFTDPIDKLYDGIEVTYTNKTLLDASIASIEHKIASLTRLYDLSFELRGELLKKAVNQIQSDTNGYLEKYFDAEIRVFFSAEDLDNFDVIIQKSGFECSFKQLSKGQRQLLKLCFAVSIMAASANTAGIHFSNIFMDEALDGLDDDLKIKAFNLLSELESEHESVIIIDHAPAFQNLFSKRYHVTMDSDVSSIELEHE